MSASRHRRRAVAMTPSEVDDLLGGRHTMVLATIGAGGMRVRVESVVSWDHRKLVAAG